MRATLRSLGWWATLVALLGTVSSPGLAVAQGTSLVGTITVHWGDGPPGSRLALPPRFTLTDDQGGGTPLEIDETHLRSLGGALALDRQRVAVQGTFAAVPSVAGGGTALWVSSLRVELPSTSSEASVPGASPALVSGSHPWVTILCRFADSAGTTPALPSYFEGLMGAAYPGMNHYWREQSYGTANIDGSLVVGWFTLPRTRAQYLVGGTLNHQLALDDCTQMADPTVFFPSFDGVNLMFNEILDCCAWGGSAFLTRDGQTRPYRVTWLPPWGWQDHDVVGHEMGHGFGLPHSSGPYTATYDSRWDVMSGGGRCQPAHPTYGCLGVHTISFHKDVLGWVPASQRYVPENPSSQTITLEPLSETASGSSYHLARIPIGTGSTRFYTVEARRFTGYDSQVPGEAVVIHNVDTTLSDRNAKVVEGDTGNTNPNDAGAMWLPGETFTDAARGVSVQVNASSPAGVQVTISRGTVNPEISVAPLALSFGDVAVGAASATQYVTVRQDGTGTLWIGALAKGGADPGEFRKPMASDLCSNASLTLGASCMVGVRFQPTQAGAQTATLVIPNGDANENPVNVTLVGTGLGPEVRTAPAAVDFGSLPVGTRSDLQLVTVTNDGPGVLGLGSLVLGGPNAADFRKPLPHDGCSGRTLASGESCTVGVRFWPAAQGSMSARLKIPTSDADEALVRIPLNGISLGP